MTSPKEAFSNWNKISFLISHSPLNCAEIANSLLHFTKNRYLHLTIRQDIQKIGPFFAQFPCLCAMTL